LQGGLGRRGGVELYRSCRGEVDSRIVTELEPKSLSRETTYRYDTRRRETIIATISALAADVVGDLHDEGYRGRTVTVKIRYRDFRTHTRALTLPEPINDGDAIRHTAVALLDRFALDRTVRLAGVRVAGLTKAGNAETGKRGNAEQPHAKDDS